MNENELDGIHFVEYNVSTAKQYAKQWRSELLEDRVLLALDIRDPIAYQLASAGRPKSELDATIKRFEQAEMIPTMWAILPRTLIVPILEDTGMKFAKQALDDVSEPGHFWFLGFTAGGCGLKQLAI